MFHSVFHHWRARLEPLLPYVLTACVGFCLMCVELVASRVVAPYIGVSIFTWTSVIGMVLIGVSAGAYVGGVWADQKHSRAWIGKCLMWSGISVLLVVYLVPLLGRWFEGSGVALWERALLFSMTCFLVPAFFLSTLGPQIARIALPRLSAAGKTVGALGAWNALGSLLGTALAGFILIPLIGTRWILTGIAFSLLVIGYWVTAQKGIWKQLWTITVLLLFTGTVFAPTMCQRETNYYCIRVGKETKEATLLYLLRLDHLVHSYVDPRHPARVGYGYEQLYRHLIALRRGQADAFSSLFIGGGGYTLPRYLEALYPQSHVVVAEIDPGVTKANHEFMELSSTTTIQSVNEDARMFLRNASSSLRFDFIFGDAFNDFSVPYHLTTEEFQQQVKRHLTPGGIYALNIIDDVKYGQFLAAMIRTLRPVWKYVYLAPLGDELKAGRNTFVLIASDEPIDPLAWESVVPPPKSDEAWMTGGVSSQESPIDPSTFHLLSDQEVDAFLSTHDAPVLRDDFVPLDRYLAPVFHDAY